MHRSAPTTRNDLDPNVSSTKVEDPGPENRDDDMFKTGYHGLTLNKLSTLCLPLTPPLYPDSPSLHYTSLQPDSLQGMFPAGPAHGPHNSSSASLTFHPCCHALLFSGISSNFTQHHPSSLNWSGYVSSGPPPPSWFSCFSIIPQAQGGKVSVASPFPGLGGAETAPHTILMDPLPIFALGNVAWGRAESGLSIHGSVLFCYHPPPKTLVPKVQWGIVSLREQACCIVA